jgi:hypothetical protein
MGEPQHFVAACEQLRLLQCRAATENGKWQMANGSSQIVLALGHRELGRAAMIVMDSNSDGHKMGRTIQMGVVFRALRLGLTA